MALASSMIFDNAVVSVDVCNGLVWAISCDFFALALKKLVIPFCPITNMKWTILKQLQDEINI